MTGEPLASGRLLRVGLSTLALLTVGSVLIGSAVSGRRGALGALAGVGLCGLFLGIGLGVAVGAMRWLPSDLTVAVVLLGYAVKVTLLGILAFYLASLPAIDPGVIGATTGAGALLWTMVQVGLAVRDAPPAYGNAQTQVKASATRAVSVRADESGAECPRAE